MKERVRGTEDGAVFSPNEERDAGYRTTMWHNKIDIGRTAKREVENRSSPVVLLRWYATRRTRVTYLKCCRDWACFVSTVPLIRSRLDF